MLTIGHIPRVVSVCSDGTKQLQRELDSLVQQEAGLRKQLEGKEKRLQSVEGNLQELQQKIQDLQAELATELHNHLSAAEQQELAGLAPHLKQLQVRHPLPCHRPLQCCNAEGLQAQLLRARCSHEAVQSVISQACLHFVASVACHLILSNLTHLSCLLLSNRSKCIRLEAAACAKDTCAQPAAT